MRTGHLARISISFVLVLPSAIAQLPERYTTIPGELSGYYWLSLARNERVAFTYGFLAGYHQAPPDNSQVREAAKDACLSQLKTPDSKQRFDCILKSLDVKSNEYRRWENADPTPNGAYGDIVEAADAFFAEPANRVMPITAAWVIAKWKQEGRPQAEIEEMMDLFRKTYIRAVRESCEQGLALMGITESRCATVGSALKKPSAR